MRNPVGKYLTLILFIPLVYCKIASADVPVSIAITPNKALLDITDHIKMHKIVGDRLQLETTDGLSGAVHNLEVRSVQQGRQITNWMVFSLRNETGEPLSKLLVVPPVHPLKSGVSPHNFRSDIIANISTDHGAAPKREESHGSSVYSFTIDPMTNVTFIAELNDISSLPKVAVWEPNAYRNRLSFNSIIHGSVLGITVLITLLAILAAFLSKGTDIFFYASGLSAATVFYTCVNTGLLHTVFGAPANLGLHYLAGAELLMGATMLLFTCKYLDPETHYTRYLNTQVSSTLVVLFVFAVLMLDSALALKLTRTFIIAVSILGTTLTVYLLGLRSARAVSFIPTWMFFIFSVTTAGLAIYGRISSDVIRYNLSAGPVLLLLGAAFAILQELFTSENTVRGRSKYRSTLAIIGAGDFVWDWNVNYDTIWVDPAVENMLGMKRGELGSLKRWLQYTSIQDNGRLRSILDQVVEQRKGRIMISFRMRSMQGALHWFQLRARPVVAPNGEIVRCVGTLLNITDAKIAEEHLRNKTIHDNLTGLPNRQLFIDRIAYTISHIQGYTIESVSIFILDLDNFKFLNDNFGVSAGDIVLMIAARRLARCIKPQDTLARIGANQFGIIVNSEKGDDRLIAFAEKLHEVLREPMPLCSDQIAVTASIGIATHKPSANKAGNGLVTEAELAVVHAKKLGGNRSETFSPLLRNYYIDSNTIATDLQTAIENSEIHVLFQPIVSVSDDRIAAFETLARWNHPKYGPVMPSEFIAIAEKANLVTQLDALVLRKALQALVRWRMTPEIADHIFLSVNISGKQLMNTEAASNLKSMVAMYNLDPGNLQLEVTESFMLESPEYTANIVNGLRETGFKLALDDFGTGYSSLSYLEAFAFDAIKIDQQFVRSKKETRKVILNSLIDLSHSLNMQVIAEGVETDDQITELRELECDFMQGYFYGHPADEKSAELALISQKEATSTKKITAQQTV